LPKKSDSKLSKSSSYDNKITDKPAKVSPASIKSYHSKLHNYTIKRWLNNMIYVAYAWTSKGISNFWVIFQLFSPTKNVYLNSDEYNELVSCDSCGYYTHEGCYGITDAESKQSTSSSASTEPWFCNSCLFDDSLDPKTNDSLKNKCKFLYRDCELCPNIECGLLKETDHGK
jgi:hypothetical protein